jgi:hypothetical protein
LKYVVPQRVRGSEVGDRLDLYLRVRSVYGKSSLQVKRGAQVLKIARRLRLNPGEMERLRLNGDAIADAVGSDLVVDAVEAPG